MTTASAFGYNKAPRGRLSNNIYELNVKGGVLQTCFYGSIFCRVGDCAYVQLPLFVTLKCVLEMSSALLAVRIWTGRCLVRLLWCD